jgi:hypothetical protein
MKPAREEDIPKVTHTGIIDLLGVKARVHRLDDGRTVIEAEDFHKILEAMGITPADLEGLVGVTENLLKANRWHP